MKTRAMLLTMLIVYGSATAADARLVACVGDSITYGAGISDRTNNSYPAQLQRILQQYDPTWEVRNFSVSGATLLRRGDKPYVQESTYGSARASNPDVVVIKLGTNDSKPQNWQYKDGVKGGQPGQAILSQSGQSGAGALWLGTDASTGAVMTSLTDGARLTTSLVSQTVVTDGFWHRIRLVWDGTQRYLYVDGKEAARDTRQLGGLRFSTVGFYLGAGRALEPGMFWSGLLDDIRFYSRAVKPYPACDRRASVDAWIHPPATRGPRRDHPMATPRASSRMKRCATLRPPGT